MNDQQSSPVPDPDGSTGLSDQEAFFMLAMSMSDEQPPSGSGTGSREEAERHGWAIDFAPSAEPETSDEEVDLPPNVQFRPDEPVEAVKAVEPDEAELEDDDDEDEGEIDLREQSPFLAGLAKRFRSRSNPYNRSGKALVGNNWEVHNGHDVTALSPNGTVTEVIDPTTVPVPPLEAGDPMGLAERGPLLPPPQEPELDSDLPPLVFLDTRGDIIPSIRSTDSECAAPSPIVIEWANNQAAPAARQVEDSIAAGVGADDIEVVNFDESGVSETSVENDASDVDGVDGVDGVDSVEGVDEVVEEAARMFDQYHGPVIAVIASVATDRRAIDEALHETFVTAWESLDSFDPGEPRGPWMFALARRNASEQVAISLQLALDAGGYPEPSHRNEEVPVDKSWEAWEVRLAVDQLAPAEYDVLQMTHRQGLIHPEIAGALDSTVGAVKSHSYSGSRRLVELLDHVIRPESDSNVSEEQASAITWYLAGVADGSDLGGGERTAVKRIQTQLGSPTAWISPDAGARSRFLASVKESVSPSDPSPSVTPAPAPAVSPPGPDPVEEQASASVDSDERTPAAAPLVRPLGSGSPEPDRVPEATGEHRPIPDRKPDEDARPPYGSIIVGGALLLIALAVVTNLFGLLGGDADLARTYQLQPTVVDPDATAVVHLAPTDNGTRFEFEFGGLNPSRNGHYYSVWLQRTADGAAVPLGSFEWATPGEIIVLSGPSGYDDFDMLVINESVRDGQASLADVVVLSAAID